MPRQRSTLRGGRAPLTSSTRKGASIEGLEEIQKNIERVLDAPKAKAAKRAYLDAALYGKAQIAIRVPEGPTGNLGKAPFAAAGDPSEPNALLGINHRIAPHAHLVEYGSVTARFQKTTGRFTGYMTPRPFFRPGLAAAARGMGQIIKDRLLKIIEDAPQ